MKFCWSLLNQSHFDLSMASFPSSKFYWSMCLPRRMLVLFNRFCKQLFNALGFPFALVCWFAFIVLVCPSLNSDCFCMSLGCLISKKLCSLMNNTENSIVVRAINSFSWCPLRDTAPFPLLLSSLWTAC